MKFPVQPRRKFLPRNRAARMFVSASFLVTLPLTCVNLRENVIAKAWFVSRSSSFDEFEAKGKGCDLFCIANKMIVEEIE